MITTTAATKLATLKHQLQQQEQEKLIFDDVMPERSRKPNNFVHLRDLKHLNLRYSLRRHTLGYYLILKDEDDSILDAYVVSSHNVSKNKKQISRMFLVPMLKQLGVITN